jgi:hypothetical protein
MKIGIARLGVVRSFTQNTQQTKNIPFAGSLPARSAQAPRRCCRLSAFFNLVDQFSFGTGQIIQGPGALFGRTAYVGLSHDDWGSLTLGNQCDFMTDSPFFDRDDAAGYIGGLYNFSAGPFSKLALPHCVSAS